MKILCVADIIDPMVYSPNVKKRFPDIELVISCGDLNVNYNEFIISALNQPLYFVNGNHKGVPLKESSYGAFHNNYGSKYYGEFIDGKVVYDKSRDIIIAGLGGSMLYNGGPNQYSDRQMRHRMNKMIPSLLYNKRKYGRYLDILVTHASPKGIHDDIDMCHTGFDCFNDFIKKYKPKFLVHGHMHLVDLNRRPITVIEKTTVINVFKSYVIEV